MTHDYDAFSEKVVREYMARIGEDPYSPLSDRYVKSAQEITEFFSQTNSNHGNGIQFIDEIGISAALSDYLTLIVSSVSAAGMSNDEGFVYSSMESATLALAMTACLMYSRGRHDGFVAAQEIGELGLFDD